MSIHCPYCLSKIEIPDCVLMNLDAYGGNSVISTPCCHKGILVAPIRSYAVVAAPGEQREDNWGDTIEASTYADVKTHERQILK